MSIIDSIDSVLTDNEIVLRAQRNGLEKIPENSDEVVELLFGGEPLKHGNPDLVEYYTAPAQRTEESIARETAYYERELINTRRLREGMRSLANSAERFRNSFRAFSESVRVPRDIEEIVTYVTDIPCEVVVHEHGGWSLRRIDGQQWTMDELYRITEQIQYVNTVMSARPVSGDAE